MKRARWSCWLIDFLFELKYFLRGLFRIIMQMLVSLSLCLASTREGNCYRYTLSLRHSFHFYWVKFSSTLGLRNFAAAEVNQLGCDQLSHWVFRSLEKFSQSPPRLLMRTDSMKLALHTKLPLSGASPKISIAGEAYKRQSVS